MSKGAEMSEYGNWDDGRVEVAEVERYPVAETASFVTPEIATIAGAVLLTLGVVGLLSGKSVMMKMGPLMLSIA